jgi:hypothetical protein
VEQPRQKLGKEKCVAGGETSECPDGPWIGRGLREQDGRGKADILKRELSGMLCLRKIGVKTG